MISFFQKYYRIKWRTEITDEGTLYSSGPQDELRTCLIRNDKTVEIRASGLVAGYPKIDKITDPKQIEILLEKIAKARFCRGVTEGLDCKSVLFYTSKYANLLARCQDCKQKMLKIQDKQCKLERKLDVSRIDEADRACVVKGCPGKDTVEIRLYRIPRYDMKAWCENLQLNISDVNESSRVCCRHFDESSKKKRALKIGARPTLYLGNENSAPPNKFKCFNRCDCCIVGCNASRPAFKLHRFPQDEERLKQWLLICVIKDEMLGNKNKFICSKHFHPSMFNKSGRSLKPSAVPQMETLNWLKNNTNQKIDGLDEIQPTAHSLRYSARPEPEMHALNVIRRVLSSNMKKRKVVDEIQADDDDDDSDILDGLQCKNVCLTCAKALKDCETYRKGCAELKRALSEEQKKYEVLKSQNQELLAELEVNDLLKCE